MSTIKEIQEIKQKYDLEDVDIWCIKFEIYGDDYNHVPDEIIKKIVDNKELSVIFK
jgi:hypothetical protein